MWQDYDEALYILHSTHYSQYDKFIHKRTRARDTVHLYPYRLTGERDRANPVSITATHLQLKLFARYEDSAKSQFYDLSSRTDKKLNTPA